MSSRCWNTEADAQRLTALGLLQHMIMLATDVGRLHTDDRPRMTVLNIGFVLYTDSATIPLQVLECRGRYAETDCIRLVATYDHVGNRCWTAPHG